MRNKLKKFSMCAFSTFILSSVLSTGVMAVDKCTEGGNADEKNLDKKAESILDVLSDKTIAGFLATDYKKKGPASNILSQPFYQSMINLEDQQEHLQQIKHIQKMIAGAHCFFPESIFNTLDHQHNSDEPNAILHRDRAANKLFKSYFYPDFDTVLHTDEEDTDKDNLPNEDKRFHKCSFPITSDGKKTNIILSVLCGNDEPLYLSGEEFFKEYIVQIKNKIKNDQDYIKLVYDRIGGKKPIPESITYDLVQFNNAGHAKLRYKNHKEISKE